MSSDPADAHREIAQVLTELASDRPGAAAVIDHTGVLTFGDLAVGVRRAAHAIVSRGGPTNRLVVVPSRSDARFLVHVLGVLIAGHTPLPVTDREVTDARRHLSKHDPPGRRPRHCVPWRAVVCSATGRRTILLTHGEPPTVWRKALALGMTPGGAALLASPLHLPGPLEFAIRQLLIGGTVVVAAPFDPRTWLEAAASHRVDWAFAVPTQLSRLLDAADSATVRNAAESIRTLVHSSQPCPPRLRDRLAAVIEPDRVAEYYGTAHYDGVLQRASPLATALAGLPIPGARLRVVGAAGPLPPGQVGVIEGRSDAGLVHHRLDEPCPPPAGTWRSVGDRGVLDIEGRLQLVSVAVPGRALVGGVNVALDHVRRVVSEHPAVSDCAVAAVPDRTYGQVIAVTVTARSPRLRVEQIREHCLRRLDAAARPRQVTFAPAPNAAGRAPGGRS